MAEIFPGRYTARTEGSFVVFLIGMRINRLWAIHKWLPVARAMQPMLDELSEQKEFGFLHVETFLNWRGVTTLQYWRSFEDLHAYAHGARHLPAWKAYNQSIGHSGIVGVWHETYLIDPNHSESIYANMPRWGLAGAAEHIPVSGLRDTARQRIESPSGS